MFGSLFAATVFLGARSPSVTPVWGVTIDDLSYVDQLVTALGGLRAKPTARIVFDLSAGPSYYTDALQQLEPVANILGEPIDSSPPSGQMTVSQYVARMTQYMQGLGPLVNIWEIGNEVNGDWTCPSMEMGEKLYGTYCQAQSMHLQTALTLFYSPYFIGTDREMVTWSLTYLSATVRNGVDYVLVSYYPTSIAGGPHWPAIFKRLGAVFPNAKLGFGELGLANPDGTLSNNQAGKSALIRKMYDAGSFYPGRYIGGYFWWTFAEDAVPQGTGLWRTFYNVIH